MGKRKYKAEYAPIAERLAFRGETMEQIAEVLGVAVATLYRWRDAHEAMREALRARDNADQAVVQSLYSQATDGGNVQASMFWLKNRQPAKWRDKQEIDVSGQVSLFKLKRMKPGPE